MSRKLGKHAYSECPSMYGGEGSLRILIRVPTLVRYQIPHTVGQVRMNKVHGDHGTPHLSPRLEAHHIVDIAKQPPVFSHKSKSSRSHIISIQ